MNLLADSGRAAELHALSRDWPSLELSLRQLCDLELLLNGGFSPLRGFMDRADYDSVLGSMRLANGTLWPIPIVLDVSEDFAKSVKPGTTVALRDHEGVMLAVVRVRETWQPDRIAEAMAVYGTTSKEHPGVAYLLDSTNPWYMGGDVEGISLPHQYDFHALRKTPAHLRQEFADRSWNKVVAFQTRNPMHRAHQELTVRAAEKIGSSILIHPVVGMTKPGDVDYYTRVRCYQAILRHYPQHNVDLALLPLAMRMAGPREVLWHAIIRKNYGCTHLIVGRDHAGPGADSKGTPFYGPYDAQKLAQEYQNEIGMQIVPFNMMVYLADLDRYAPDDEVPEGAQVKSISGTELRRLLAEGQPIPEWFTFPEVTKELRRSHPPRDQQGFTVFFTGLSGSGKSTIANILLVKLLERGGRRVTLLDGDLVRRNLSSELGFSKEHRDLNIRRIGFVASEITKNGGICICAPIAPYDSVRKDVRQMIEPLGGFTLVHTDASLEVCEARDRKGLYAKARAGIVKQFTGISDPYERPDDADLVIDTAATTPEQAALQIIARLQTLGFLNGAGQSE